MLGSREQVFVSHSSVNRRFVEEDILPQLRRANCGIWFAPDNIGGGEDWRHRLREGMDSCSRLLVVVSRESVRSTEVKIEVADSTSKLLKTPAKLDARRINRRILPVLLDLRNECGRKVSSPVPKETGPKYCGSCGTQQRSEIEVDPYLLHPYLMMVNFIAFPHNPKLNRAFETGKYELNAKTGKYIDPEGIRSPDEMKSINDYVKERDKARENLETALRHPDALWYGFKRFGRLLFWLAQPAVQRVVLAVALFAALTLSINLPAIISQPEALDVKAGETSLDPPLPVVSNGGEIEILIEPVEAESNREQQPSNTVLFRTEEFPLVPNCVSRSLDTTFVSLRWNECSQQREAALATMAAASNPTWTHAVAANAAKPKPAERLKSAPGKAVVVRIKQNPTLQIREITEEEARTPGPYVFRIKSGNREKYIQIAPPKPPEPEAPSIVIEEARDAAVGGKAVKTYRPEPGSATILRVVSRVGEQDVEEFVKIAPPKLPDPKSELTPVDAEDAAIRITDVTTKNTVLSKDQTQLRVGDRERKLVLEAIINGRAVQTRTLALRSETADDGPPKIVIEEFREEQLMNKRVTTHDSGFFRIEASGRSGSTEKYVKLEREQQPPKIAVKQVKSADHSNDKVDAPERFYVHPKIPTLLRIFANNGQKDIELHVK